jgi:phosphoglycerate kinase
MPAFRPLDELDVKGRRVIVRGDLNVPVADGKVTDATRLERLAPTVRDLAGRGARVVLMSHFGRPKGRDESQSLKPILPALERALGRKVAFADDCIGPAAERAAAALKDGDVLLLENLRFHKGEEGNDPDFARALAKLGELYVNDAFSAAHRAHASTEALARLLPAAAGRLMQEELEHLGRALESPKRPLMAVVGGAKVSTKLDLLKNLVRKVDRLAIGGGMANTFLHARGIEVGKSLCERDLADTARAIEAEAKAAKCEILLPEDAVIAAALKAGVAAETVAITAVPADKLILDVGPKSVARLNAALGESKTLVWNGPLGAFETPPFDAGTNAVACHAAVLTKSGALLSVAGGGDTVAALAHAGAEGGFSYVSTAGGAFLEWLEGKTLPGVAALAQKLGKK